MVFLLSLLCFTQQIQVQFHLKRVQLSVACLNITSWSSMFWWTVSKLHIQIFSQRRVYGASVFISCTQTQSAGLPAATSSFHSLCFLITVRVFSNWSGNILASYVYLSNMFICKIFSSIKPPNYSIYQQKHWNQLLAVAYKRFWDIRGTNEENWKGLIFFSTLLMNLDFYAEATAADSVVPVS